MIGGFFMYFYDEEEEKSIKRRKRIRNTVTSLLVVAALAVGAKTAYDYQNGKFNNDAENTITSEETESEESIVAESELSSDIAEETSEGTIKVEEPATENAIEAETDSTIKVITNEDVNDDIQERATTLAEFYAKTGAHSPLYGTYSNDDMVKVIQIMNGEYEAEDMARAKYNVDYLEDYFTSILSSELYKDKMNEYISNEEDTLTSIPYDLDLTDTMLADQDYKAFILVDYLDDVHKKVMISDSREEIRSLCTDYFQCLASIVLGNGFSFNGVNYTIEDLKGIENVGLGSVLEQCTFDIIPFTYGMDFISYIDKDGNVQEVDIDTIIHAFNISGSYYTEWHSDLMSSMVK